MHYLAWNIKRYENQHAEIYTNETSDRAFEEEVMLSGFGNAQVKGEGAGVSFDHAQETFTARLHSRDCSFSICNHRRSYRRQSL